MIRCSRCKAPESSLETNELNGIQSVQCRACGEYYEREILKKMTRIVRPLKPRGNNGGFTHINTERSRIVRESLERAFVSMDDFTAPQLARAAGVSVSSAADFAHKKLISGELKDNGPGRPRLYTKPESRKEAVNE